MLKPCASQMPSEMWSFEFIIPNSSTITFCFIFYSCMIVLPENGYLFKISFIYFLQA